MNTYILVEGEEEVNAMNEIVKNAGFKFKVDILKVHPKENPKKIVIYAKKKIEIILQNNFKKIVILLDLEDRECAVEEARKLEKAFIEMSIMKEIYKKYNFHPEENLKVVIKVRKFENWLIADSKSLSNLKGFTITRSFENKAKYADNQEDAESLLKSIGTYRKGKEDLAIAKKADPLKIAQHSRSFRRFLRELGHLSYLNQSKKPIRSK